MSYHRLNIIIYMFCLIIIPVFSSCNFIYYKTIPEDVLSDEADPEPIYNITLNDDYQNFISFMFMGNRSESFGTFFNKFYTAEEDFDEAIKEYTASTIATYNRNLDSLNITPPITQTTKDKLTKVIERCSKVIQFNKSTRFIDDAVLLIGKSYFYMADYIPAERKFSEFLSKLNRSEHTEEALLYLGKIKIRLNKREEGTKILRDLMNTSRNNDIKSEASEALGIAELSQKNYKEAVNFFIQSIELTKDKEKKAVKQYLLAKIYTIYKPELAYLEYQNAMNNTSDFDLEFYSRLNYAKGLNLINRYGEAYTLLLDCRSDYREYPEFKQLADLEIANTLYLQKKYDDAINKYFMVIIDYPSTKVAADSYYYLARHYEQTENNYLKALVNYKKVNETFTGSDYSRISAFKSEALNSYFDLLAKINDTEKLVIPTFNKDLEDLKIKLDIEKGKDTKYKEEKGGDIKGKEGGGQGSGYSAKDTTDMSSEPDSLNLDNFNPEDIIQSKEKEKLPVLTDSVPALTLDTIPPGPVINEDSLKTAREDSIKFAKENEKFDSYFAIVELFLYELNRPDSAKFYLEELLNLTNDEKLLAKANYTLGNVYKNMNNQTKANELFNEVIEKYPNTIYANESRKTLGLPAFEITSDSLEVKFNQVSRLIYEKNYPEALDILYEINSEKLNSTLEPKVIYTIGWIFQNYYANKDSTLHYYNLIIKNYPTSDYTRRVLPITTYYAELEKEQKKDSITASPDSLKIQDELISQDSLTAADTTKIFPVENNIKPEQEENIPSENQQENENPEIKKPEED